MVALVDVLYNNKKKFLRAEVKKYQRLEKYFIIEVLFFQEAFQIGIYWANTNTVHKSVAIKLVHNLTSPKWKDGGNSEVVALDEEAFVDAEIRLGAFPGHQKVRQSLCGSGQRVPALLSHLE